MSLVTKKRFDKIEEDAARAMLRCDAFTDRIATLGNKITTLRNKVDELMDYVRSVSSRTIVGQWYGYNAGIAGHPVNEVVSALLEELGFSLEVSPEKLRVRRVNGGAGTVGSKNGAQDVVIDALAFEKLRRYLVAHERDIDDDVKDFGDLRSVYISLLGVEPEGS